MPDNINDERDEIIRKITGAGGAEGETTTATVKTRQHVKPDGTIVKQKTFKFVGEWGEIKLYNHDWKVHETVTFTMKNIGGAGRVMSDEVEYVRADDKISAERQAFINYMDLEPDDNASCTRRTQRRGASVLAFTQSLMSDWGQVDINGEDWHIKETDVFTYKRLDDGGDSQSSGEGSGEENHESGGEGGDQEDSGESAGEYEIPEYSDGMSAGEDEKQEEIGSDGETLGESEGEDEKQEESGSEGETPEEIVGEDEKQEESVSEGEDQTPEDQNGAARVLRSGMPPSAKPVIDFLRTLKVRDDCAKNVSRKSFEFVKCAVDKYNRQPNVDQVAVRRAEPKKLLTSPRFLTFDHVLQYAQKYF